MSGGGINSGDLKDSDCKLNPAGGGGGCAPRKLQFMQSGPNGSRHQY